MTGSKAPGLLADSGLIVVRVQSFLILEEIVLWPGSPAVSLGAVAEYVNNRR